ncbi:ergothioneine biosynthesis protein EgtB [Sinomicrobium sp. M5D2P17]
MNAETITNDKISALQNRYAEVRSLSVKICEPLEIEDYVVQPVGDVSPPKWHLGHTTWFFEAFILQPNEPGYRVFHEQYNFVFNSYYETVGTRVIRTNRGNLSRPSVVDIYRYREYIDIKMKTFFQNKNLNENVLQLIELGLNHEQQHQELLLADIKFILGHNPLFPSYNGEIVDSQRHSKPVKWISFPEGVYEIGFKGSGFCFDNELGRHKVYLNDFKIADRPVTNREFLQFMEDGGYNNFKHWHAEGWDWVKQTNAKAPLYWHFMENKWMYYSLKGLKEIDLDRALSHINFYEASAYAAWKGMRLPTEAEWEVASEKTDWGLRWEWTGSAYLPYPGFKKEPGAVGEYNGKFMVNQMVLRGASVATPKGHSRNTYRNFFYTKSQWQFTGIRLAK